MAAAVSAACANAADSGTERRKRSGTGMAIAVWALCGLIYCTLTYGNYNDT